MNRLKQAASLAILRHNDKCKKLWYAFIRRIMPRKSPVYGYDWEDP